MCTFPKQLHEQFKILFTDNSISYSYIHKKINCSQEELWCIPSEIHRILNSHKAPGAEWTVTVHSLNTTFEKTNADIKKTKTNHDTFCWIAEAAVSGSAGFISLFVLYCYLFCFLFFLFCFLFCTLWLHKEKNEWSSWTTVLKRQEITHNHQPSNKILKTLTEIYQLMVPSSPMPNSQTKTTIFPPTTTRPGNVVCQSEHLEQDNPGSSHGSLLLYDIKWQNNQDCTRVPSFDLVFAL